MAKQKETDGFGELPPQYHFALNPYPDERFTICPQCRQKTGQRKLPLLIHIDPVVLVALNITNRYCKRCDLLIAHQAEVEHCLTEQFRRTEPDLIGNEYLVLGTVAKQARRESLRQPKTVQELRSQSSDFESYRELRVTTGGWFRDNEEPPELEPPPATEWVK